MFLGYGKRRTVASAERTANGGCLSQRDAGDNSLVQSNAGDNRLAR